MAERAKDVYVGAWVDWGKGAISGATITVPSAYGAILVAFLALYVRLAGSHFWNIVCFFTHQLRSAPHLEQDGLYHQQQAVLRGGLDDTAVLWQLAKLAWCWKDSTRRIFRRSVPLGLAAGAHALGFAAAGLFSSRVASATDLVLVRSPLCGWMDEPLDVHDFPAMAEIDVAGALLVAGRWSYDDALEYARSCYGAKPTLNSVLCSTHAKVRLEYETGGKPCPFADGACGSSHALFMDSGLVDSDLDLGINAPPGDRIKCRKTMTCAPIPADERYAGNWTLTPPPSVLITHFGNQYRSYYMGPYNGYLVRNETAILSNYSLALGTGPYELSAMSGYAVDESKNVFSPIDDLKQDDADVTILMLVNRVVYTQEVTDPWFRSARKFEVDGVPGIGYLGPFYAASQSLGVLGCTEQYQFCNGDRCSPLTGIFGLKPPEVLTSENGSFSSGSSSSTFLDFNTKQAATYALVWKAIWGAQVQYAANLLKDRVLVARDLLFGSSRMSSPVRDRQWEAEARNLFNVSLVMLQRRVVEYAAPPVVDFEPDVPASDYVVAPNTTAGRRLCATQKVRSNAYDSFSVLGLAIIVVGGGLIMILNTFLTELVGWVQRRWRRPNDAYRRLEWIESETLQLQRMAFEGRGVGPWRGKEDAVPVTVTFEQRFPFPGSAQLGSNEPNVDEELQAMYRKKRKGEELEHDDARVTSTE
ncbi:hypothetical protein BDY21DRAFT_393710 [Lineolata rhizophorae]|uniref:Uncharacterized protein n=1 Tax=Lineolata rhizophorae TaxID=578093 RepID=A0A6A6NYS2_9PEZI|nr:hypothetical protein BDY21DRAFT_393710 [Lineolata rhizophorae]